MTCVVMFQAQDRDGVPAGPKRFVRKHAERDADRASVKVGRGYHVAKLLPDGSKVVELRGVGDGTHPRSPVR